LQVNAQYEWEFDANVRLNFRMIGDRLSSSVIELGGGHAVCVSALLAQGSWFGEKDHQLVLTLKPLRAAGGAATAGNGQWKDAPAGRWRATLTYSKYNYSYYGMFCFLAKRNKELKNSFSEIRDI
jgi:hypothetical protein